MSVFVLAFMFKNLYFKPLKFKTMILPLGTEVKSILKTDRSTGEWVERKTIWQIDEDFPSFLNYK